MCVREMKRKEEVGLVWRSLESVEVVHRKIDGSMDNQQSTKYKPTVVQKNGGKKEREGLSTTAGRWI